MGGLELVTVADEFSIEFMEKRERDLGIDIGRRRFWRDVAYRIDKQGVCSPLHCFSFFDLCVEIVCVCVFLLGFRVVYVFFMCEFMFLG